MNSIKNFQTITLSIFFLLLFFSKNTFSQDFILDNQASNLIVSGTSSLHDWDIEANQQHGQLTLDVSNQLKIQKLKIDIVAESLKSGKRGMDKNTYKALKTSDYKNITFQWIETVEIISLDNDDYKVKCNGNLTVAGTSKKINLDFILKLSSNKVTLKGETTIKMTAFNINPPTALLGTITTGDQISIKFNTILNK